MGVIKLPPVQKTTDRFDPAFSQEEVPSQPPDPAVPPAVFRRLTTLDTTPVNIAIATLPNVGDAVQIPSINVTARTRDGAQGRQTGFIGAAHNRLVGGVFLIASLFATGLFGGMTGSVAIVPIGSDVVIRLVGISDIVDWTVSYSVLVVTGGRIPD